MTTLTIPDGKDDKYTAVPDFDGNMVDCLFFPPEFDCAGFLEITNKWGDGISIDVKQTTEGESG